MRIIISFLAIFLLAGCSYSKGGEVQELQNSLDELKKENQALYGNRDSYVGEVIQVGGIGSRSATKNAWSGPNASDVANFDATNLVITSFNRPGDLMWASCKEGYTLVKCESATENLLLLDDSFGCGLGIEDKLKNIVQILCVEE